VILGTGERMAGGCSDDNEAAIEHTLCCARDACHKYAHRPR
jgi:hypothetical protein